MKASYVAGGAALLLFTWLMCLRLHWMVTGWRFLFAWWIDVPLFILPALIAGGFFVGALGCFAMAFHNAPRGTEGRWEMK